MSLVGALVLFLAAEPAAAAPRVLSGAWRLDAARSEDLRQKMRAQMEEERGSGGEERRGPMGGRGGGRGPGRGMGGPPRGGPRGGSFDPGAMRQAMDEVLGAPRTIAVTVGETEIEIVAGDGSIRRLRPDGRKAKHEGGAVTETRARWDGDVLVDESWVGERMHLTQRWARQPAGELRVEVTVEGRGAPVSAVRIYVPDGAR